MDESAQTNITVSSTILAGTNTPGYQEEKEVQCVHAASKGL